MTDRLPPVSGDTIGLCCECGYHHSLDGPCVHPHKCPCGIFASGHCVTRLGRVWHADCYVIEIEKRADAVLDAWNRGALTSLMHEPMRQLREAVESKEEGSFRG